ncbi:MAG: cobalamin biosynthesis protein CobQ [Thermoleophilia bacterium]|nr:cobalamin biosynthesis protein CobQ [Thermoleophilia bacterium]
MREVDEALARAFAARTEVEAERPTTVPPAPHVGLRRDHAADRPRDLPAAEDIGLRPPVAWPALVTLLTETYPDRFERLADALEGAARRSGTKAFWFASGQRSEGCTTLLFSLARILGRREGRTVLVDADLTTPNHARQLALGARVGLESVVTGHRALADALVESPRDGLTFLPLLTAPSQPRAFLADPGWARTVARLRREFDLVLIDGGPLFQGYGAARLPAAADAAVIVRNRSLTSDRALGRARTLLDNAGVPLLGVAETFAPRP